MRDDGISQDLDDNLLESIVAFSEAVEKEVQIV
jgi:hypothetical protein